MADQQMSPETAGPPIAGDPYAAPASVPNGSPGGAYVGGPSPETPEQDAQQQKIEVEARDQLGLCLAMAAEKYTKAGEASLGNGDSGSAKDFAQGALSLTQALVLVAPLEHNSPANTTNPNVPPAPRHLTPQVSPSFGEAAMPHGSGQIA